MRSVVYMAAVFLPVFLLGACGATLRPATLADTGYFETDKKIIFGGVKINKEFRTEYKQIIFINANEEDERFDTFYLESFRNMEQFERVLGKEELKALIFEKGLANRVQSISDRTGLHNLQKEIGPFLVVDLYSDWLGGYTYGKA